MDTLSWPHQDESIGIVNPSFLTTTTTTPSTTTTAARQVVERKVRPQKERALHCPRCNSTNTKFCYYNNYSLTQPRYFCKTCRRYWTEGGSLRNVPVGGGSRKNKRPFSSNTSTITTTATAPPPPPPPPPPLQDPLRDTQNPTFATTGRQGSFCGLLGNTAEDTPTWPSGIDLLARCPFVQAPMMEAAGGGGGGQLGLQGLRAAGLDLGVDGGGSYDCMQPAAGLGLVLPFQEMGKASAGDLVMGIHGGGGGGDAAASAGGVWNW